MIVRPQTSWFRMLLVWNGSVLPAIVPQLLLILAVSVLALLTRGHVLGMKIPLDTAPFPLLGVSLAIFLAFRNNASYERYMEARKHWGHILISARTLTSQALRYLPGLRGDFDRAIFARRLIAFVYALKHQLRNSDPLPALERYLPLAEAEALERRHFLPVLLLDRLRAMLQGASAHAQPAGQALWMLDTQLNALADAVGGCERIASTPIPYPYGVLVHRTVYAYCFLLPFGLVHTIGAATPLISVFVAYTLFALEAIAQEVAEPFGDKPNSLALDAISRTIERSILELCEQPLPEEIPVGRGYRMR
jgi:putative membrane protein